jgi:hypothetical protein
MNNQAAQTMPGDLRWKIDTLNPSSSGVVALTQEEWAYVAAALSQPAGVPEGYALVPLEPTREMQKAYFDSIDKHLERAMTSPLFGRFDNHNLAYRAMLAAAPAASGGDHYNGVTQPDGSGFRHGDNSVGALPEALPKPQVANPADTTYPSPPSGASLSSNPNPVTPGLSSEPGASVSERARDERFTAMLIGIIADVQDALGFTDEDKECSNGSLEIVDAINELRKEASRYRWIRDRIAGKEHVAELVEYNHDAHPELRDEVDAAIDAARAGERGSTCES